MESAFRSLVVLAAVGLAACSGTIEEPGAFLPADARDDSAWMGAAGSGSSPASVSVPNPAGLDVNWVGIHRLNNTEYDNTLRDLLGVSSTPARSFIADEQALGFDSIAAALGMTDAQYEQYFDAADSLVESVFADAALRGKIVTCTPAPANEQACPKQLITDFGRRAWRRPLKPAEVERFLELASDARALGADFHASIAQVVKATLASVPFLYRIELDPAPNSRAAHRLDGYELASRLSYLVWSSMPDEPLFALAANGSLLEDAQLSAQLARMRKDPKAQRFVSSFAGQWLGLRDLRSHQVEASVFPDWDEPLREAMIAEGLRYFGVFLDGSYPMSEFFSADINFVDARLAKLYGLKASKFDPLQPISDRSDGRAGFLGLASFLTFSSFSYRTAPTLRGKWVLENLLCAEIPPPPPNVPQLEEEMSKAQAQSINVRERLAEHRVNPQCSGCHTILDPIGLGLENFDAIGRYRTNYAEGDAIDATGELPDGAKFDGLLQLSALLAKDPRLIDCVSQKLLTYALSRQLVETDQPFLQQLRARWTQAGLGLPDLLEYIVLSDLFRSRRGEGT